MSRKKRNEPQPLLSELSQVEKLEKENRMLKIEKTAFRGRTKNERIARIIHSLRGHFRLKGFQNSLTCTGKNASTEQLQHK